jgi:hypothetical protein
MSDNKKNNYLVSNIFTSLPSKDLSNTIENCNNQLSSSIKKLSELFSKPREFVTSDYSESNKLVNSIVKLKETNPVNVWISELTEFSSAYIKKEHSINGIQLNGSKCSEIINNAAEIIEKFKKDYSDIIKDVQYHDIIRQKLEHVIEINTDILQELDSLEKSSEIKDNNDYKHLQALKEIINIEIAQLIYCSELSNSVVDRLLSAFNEQKNLIDQSEVLAQNFKSRLINLIDVIHHNKELTEILNSNKDKFDSTYQLSTNLIENELSKLLPNSSEFSSHLKIYENHISEIKEISSTELSFYQITQNIIESLKVLQKKLATDDEMQDIDKENNLDFLKQKYTMNSEHKIHELAMENELLKELFSEITEDEDDNDIEFF